MCLSLKKLAEFELVRSESIACFSLSRPYSQHHSPQRLTEKCTGVCKITCQCIAKNFAFILCDRAHIPISFALMLHICDRLKCTAHVWSLFLYFQHSHTHGSSLSVPHGICWWTDLWQFAWTIPVWRPVGARTHSCVVTAHTSAKSAERACGTRMRRMRLEEESQSGWGRRDCGESFASHYTQHSRMAEHFDGVWCVRGCERKHLRASLVGFVHVWKNMYTVGDGDVKGKRDYLARLFF